VTDAPQGLLCKSQRENDRAVSVYEVDSFSEQSVGGYFCFLFWLYNLQSTAPAPRSGSVDDLHHLLFDIQPANSFEKLTY
jgi:hypothetical protein